MNYKRYFCAILIATIAALMVATNFSIAESDPSKTDIARDKAIKMALSKAVGDAPFANSQDASGYFAVTSLKPSVVINDSVSDSGIPFPDFSRILCEAIKRDEKTKELSILGNGCRMHNLPRIADSSVHPTSPPTAITLTLFVDVISPNTFSQNILTPLISMVLVADRADVAPARMMDAIQYVVVPYSGDQVAFEADVTRLLIEQFAAFTSLVTSNVGK